MRVHQFVLLELPRRNLRDLVDSAPANGDNNNFQRTFWRWLQRQPWRKMLPQPFECLVYLGLFGCRILRWRDHAWYMHIWHKMFPRSVLCFQLLPYMFHSGWMWSCRTTAVPAHCMWGNGICFFPVTCSLAICNWDVLFGIWCVSGLTGMHWCRLEVWGDLSLWLEPFQSTIHWTWRCAVVCNNSLHVGDHVYVKYVNHQLEVWKSSSFKITCGGLRRWKRFGTLSNIRIGFANIPFCHRLILALVWKYFWFGGFGERFLWDPFELMY